MALEARQEEGESQGDRKQSQNMRIQFLNVEDGSTFSNTIVLIIGKVKGFDPRSIQTLVVRGLDSITCHIGPHGLFKAILELQPGVNLFQFTLHDHVQDLSVICEPLALTSAPRFKLCLLSNKSEPDLKRRFILCAKLLQCFMTESLFLHQPQGSRRVTLALDTQEVLEIDTDLPRTEEVSSRALWHVAAKSVIRARHEEDDMSQTKYLVLLDNSGSNGDRISLGNGGLALFGLDCVKYWPTTLDQVRKSLDDHDIHNVPCQLLHPTISHTKWMCYSASIGAIAHEVGHCLGLDHTPAGIMGSDWANLASFLGPCRADQPEKTAETVTKPASNGKDLLNSFYQRQSVRNQRLIYGSALWPSGQAEKLLQSQFLMS